MFCGLFPLGFNLWWIAKEGGLRDVIQKCQVSPKNPLEST